MIGPERGDPARKAARMIEDVAWAESAGLDTAWVPQIPGDFDALTAVALMGTRTARIELGTAVVPLQAQHPVALARQALSVQAATGGRLALGIGPSHHWIVQDMLGLPYHRPAGFTRDYLDVLDVALRGPGPAPFTTWTTPTASRGWRRRSPRPDGERCGPTGLPRWKSPSSPRNSGAGWSTFPSSGPFSPTTCVAVLEDASQVELDGLPEAGQVQRLAVLTEEPSPNRRAAMGVHRDPQRPQRLRLGHRRPDVALIRGVGPHIDDMHRAGLSWGRCLLRGRPPQLRRVTIDRVGIRAGC